MKSIFLLILSIFILINFTMEKAMSNEEILGSLVIVGGRLEADNKDIYNKFIELSMKYRNKKIEEIKIGIMPAGNSDPVQSAENFRKNLVSYCVPEKNIETIPVAVKDDKSTENVDEATWKDNAYNKEIAEKIKDYDAIWFVGGDQLRYTSVLLDKDGKNTPVLEAIWEIYKKGAVIGGTSAGAAIMSDPMIQGGTSLDALNYEFNYDGEKDKKFLLTKGLGFFKYGIVDQHFSQRGRLGRLIVSALFSNKIAFGVDENTAMVFDNLNKTIEVMGEGGLTIVNFTSTSLLIDSRQIGRGLAIASSIIINEKLKINGINNIIISYIEKGDKYNLSTGEFEVIQTNDPDENDYKEKPYVSTSIFDDIKKAITVYLYKVKETKGLAFEMTDDREGKGFILKFKKADNTKIYCGSKGKAAINVHMDIIPVKIELK